MVVDDLFEDMKDGVKLLALLEVLSGQKLPCEQGRRMKRIHAVANIGTALKFLEGRKIFNISQNSKAGNQPLITTVQSGTQIQVPVKSGKKILQKWYNEAFKMILEITIEELTSNLPQLQSLSSSASSVDSLVSSETPSPPSKRKVTTKIQGNAKKALLKWVQYTAGK
ncbi:Nesprin-1 [Saguinus oedipus]|uniref:Nesprin-1 n=1 Tax=Saguinus oedipus TaxID=9490 RepID=A0ABQ9VYT4_SAGOE|nr:Nesprin-1 [Saguinus oedipus]